MANIWDIEIDYNDFTEFDTLYYELEGKYWDISSLRSDGFGRLYITCDPTEETRLILTLKFNITERDNL